MRAVRIAGAVVWVIALVGMVGAQAAVKAPEASEIAAPANLEGNPPPPSSPLFTIAKGEHSGWGHDDPQFSGADLLIRTPHAWGAFWARHTREHVPPPVDFRHFVVIAAIQGLQPSAGGPNISIVGVHAEGPFIGIAIVDDHRPGTQPGPTNPFHIVLAPRQLFHPHHSVVFQHLRPMPESGMVTGRVLALSPHGDPVPLPRAHVVLEGPGHARHALSGMDGSYFFVNVEPGNYVLRAEHPEFEPAEVTLHVPPNARIVHDFFLRPLPQDPGAIVGRVLGMEAGGTFPLEGALVQLFQGNVEIDRRVTPRDGSFEFEPVPPGVYRVVASHPEFHPEEFIAEVHPGEVVEHEFVLRPGGHENGIVRGRVLAELPGGVVPLEGALVELAGMGGAQTQRTNREGHFLFEEVRPGIYRLTAAHEGFVPQSVMVRVEPGGVVEHEFILHEGSGEPGAFAGRVMGMSENGRLIPIEGALVSLINPDGEVIQTHTNRQGAFIMRDVPPGPYLAVAEAEGWEPAEVRVEIVSGEVTHHCFVLRRP